MTLKPFIHHPKKVRTPLCILLKTGRILNKVILYLQLSTLSLPGKMYLLDNDLVLWLRKKFNKAFTIRIIFIPGNNNTTTQNNWFASVKLALKNADFETGCCKIS